MNRLRARCAGDGGFTLIEVVIVMIILGIIIAPLASAFYLGIGTATTSGQDVGNSADAQVLSAFFADDVASANAVSTDAACGGNNTVIQFRWQDGTLERRVAYTVSADSGAAGSLHVASAYQLTRV